MSLDLSIQLSPHFALHEFFVTTQGGGYRALVADFEALPKDKQQRYLTNMRNLASCLEAVRKEFGSKPIIITSGWRSRRVNAIVGGSPKSRHLTGEAADIVIRGVQARDIQKQLDPHWLGGMGYGSDFTHLDIRPYRARWNY